MLSKNLFLAAVAVAACSGPDDGPSGDGPSDFASTGGDGSFATGGIGNIYRSTTGQQESSGSTYSFFDPAAFYDYTLDPASEVEALLTECAGPRLELGQ